MINLITQLDQQISELKSKQPPDIDWKQYFEDNKQGPFICYKSMLLDENNIIYDFQNNKFTKRSCPFSWIYGYSLDPKNEGMKWSHKYQKQYPEVCPEDFWFSVVQPPWGQGKEYKEYEERCSNEKKAWQSGNNGHCEKTRLVLLEARKQDILLLNK